MSFVTNIGLWWVVLCSFSLSCCEFGSHCQCSQFPGKARQWNGLSYHNL